MSELETRVDRSATMLRRSIGAGLLGAVLLSGTAACTETPDSTEPTMSRSVDANDDVIDKEYLERMAVFEQQRRLNADATVAELEAQYGSFGEYRTQVVNPKHLSAAYAESYPDPLMFTDNEFVVNICTFASSLQDSQGSNISRAELPLEIANMNAYLSNYYDLNFEESKKKPDYAAGESLPKDYYYLFDQCLYEGLETIEKYNGPELG